MVYRVHGRPRCYRWLVKTKRRVNGELDAEAGTTCPSPICGLPCDMHAGWISQIRHAMGPVGHWSGCFWVAGVAEQLWFAFPSCVHRISQLCRAGRLPELDILGQAQRGLADYCMPTRSPGAGRRGLQALILDRIGIGDNEVRLPPRRGAALFPFERYRDVEGQRKSEEVRGRSGTWIHLEHRSKSPAVEAHAHDVQGGLVVFFFFSLKQTTSHRN